MHLGCGCVERWGGSPTAWDGGSGAIQGVGVKGRRGGAAPREFG